MVSDYKQRNSAGLVCCLRDMGNGKTRVILDDVTNPKSSTDADWSFYTLFSWKDYDTKDIEELELSDSELAAFGFHVLARLVALKKHPINK